MSRRYQIPRTGHPIADKGDLTRPWREYLAGVEEVSGRVAAPVANASSANLAAADAKINELLAALRAAGLMET